MKANKRIRDPRRKPKGMYRLVAFCPTDKVFRNVTTWPKLPRAPGETAQRHHPNIRLVGRGGV